MDVSFQIEGLDRIDRATTRVREAIAKELARGMLASVARVEKEAKTSILQGNKTGRLYRRGKTVFHRASAPGEAPASDTGLLVNSIRGRLDKQSLASGSLEGTVSVGVSYGRPLEFGTQKTAARPFLFPAFERSKAWIKERLNFAVRKAVIDIGKK